MNVSRLFFSDLSKQNEGHAVWSTILWLIKEAFRDGDDSFSSILNKAGAKKLNRISPFFLRSWLNMQSSNLIWPTNEITLNDLNFRAQFPRCSSAWRHNMLFSLQLTAPLFLHFLNGSYFKLLVRLSTSSPPREASHKFSIAVRGLYSGRAEAAKISHDRRFCLGLNMNFICKWSGVSLECINARQSAWQKGFKFFRMPFTV